MGGAAGSIFAKRESNGQRRGATKRGMREIRCEEDEDAAAGERLWLGGRHNRGEE